MERICGITRDIDKFFRDELKLPKVLAQITNIRKYPVIDLRDIIIQIFLMPFFSLTSLLSLNKISRKKPFKKVNSRPRKCLGFRTPYEVFESLTGINIKKLCSYALMT